MFVSRRKIAFTVIVLLAGLAIGSSAKQVNQDNVRSFGATGDGIADDTAALQKIVDSGAGNIRLRGVYRLTEPVVIDLDKVGYTSFSGDGIARIVMSGPGPALKFVGTHFKSADPDGFEENVWLRQRMPLVDGIAIEGNHPEAVGIEAVGTMELTVTRVHIRGVMHCIHLTGNNRNLIISDCHLYENRGIGIFYDNVNLHQSNITGCHISYNRRGGIVSRGGNVRNIHITGCDIESNMSPETPPTANVLIDSADSSYGTGEVAITGCTIQHNSPSPDSANIRIIGRSKPDRNGKLVREGNVTITGNVLSDVKVNVHLKDCRGVILTGNTFWMGYTHNLLIEDCSNIIVGANNFDRNPRYDYGNSLDARNSLLVCNSADCTLTGLHITNVWKSPAGLTIESCKRMNVTNCTILDCDGIGLLLKDVTNSRLSGCLISDSRPNTESTSLRVVGGGDNMIVNNLLATEPQIPENAARVSGNVHP
ncbi:MAG: right-handed parallel beta-helix repeat-containing protein [Sedimentisphaerales bacterium]|nr:right-handed parallel beta-helix repeat-containing protein [Sedimentisphaerales bacterium]